MNEQSSAVFVKIVEPPPKLVGEKRLTFRNLDRFLETAFLDEVAAEADLRQWVRGQLSARSLPGNS